MRTRPAFTLIEVLVVVAVIALLVSILIPALSRARQQARKVVCGAHQHGLMSAIHMYASDSKGWTHQSPNQGLWNDAYLTELGQTPSVTMYKPNDPDAYWGIAYYKYARNQEVFACPSQIRVDDWPENGWGQRFQKYFKHCSYGLNGWIANVQGAHKPKFKGDKPGMLLDIDFKRPATTIAFQDHIEQRMETPFQGGTDTFNMDRNGRNLWQWRGTWRKNEFPDFEQECFRHLGRSNTAFLDGHVADLRNFEQYMRGSTADLTEARREELRRMVPLEWYTGGASWQDLPWVEDP